MFPWRLVGHKGAGRSSCQQRLVAPRLRLPFISVWTRYPNVAKPELAVARAGER